MVKWVVGDSVGYEVNGTWYPGYIARSDSKKLYFKYEASKFKSYEEPIDKTSRDDLARLRAGTGSGPPASAKKKKPAAARKPAAKSKPAAKAKSPAKKKTVRARRRHSLLLTYSLSHRSRNPRPANPRPSPRPRSLPRSRASPRPPPRRRRGATRSPGAGPRRSRPRRRRVPRRRSRPPARKRSSSLKDSIFTREDYVKLNLRGNQRVSPTPSCSALQLISSQHATTPS